ncbi:MAG: nuclear transport factor 2 family protein, partial [Bacteroidota bacterium]
DLEGWVELFAPDGWIEDPVGSRPYVTHGGLRIFFRNFMKAFSTDLEMTCTSLHVDEQTRTARAEWTVSAKHRAFPISFAGREEFSFGPDGLIEYVRVYHDPEHIGRQLADAYTAHFRTAVQQGTVPKRPHRSSRPRRA